MSEVMDIGEIVIKEEICIEYNCFICQAAFPDEFELQNHIQCHEETEE